jgi:alpha-glucosidase
LSPGFTYVAEIYADGEGAHYVDNAYALDIQHVLVDVDTVLTLELAPGGGQAIRFYPASDEERNTLPKFQQ